MAELVGGVLWADREAPETGPPAAADAAAAATVSRARLGFRWRGALPERRVRLEGGAMPDGASLMCATKRLSGWFPLNKA